MVELFDGEEEDEEAAAAAMAAAAAANSDGLAKSAIVAKGLLAASRPAEAAFPAALKLEELVLGLMKNDDDAFEAFAEAEF